jgi:hypothetical protein
VVYEPPKKSKSYDELFKFNFKFGGSDMVFAQGGIHGVKANQTVFTLANGKKKKDLDVGSFYPYLYWKYGIRPDHLEGFTDFVGALVTLRMQYKKTRKLFANGLKIAINRIFGGFSDPHGWLFDTQALLKVTINGQLLILMLAEQLELAGIEVYYYNTDGITVEYEDSQLEELNRIWKEWEEKTNLILEDAEF